MALVLGPAVHADQSGGKPGAATQELQPAAGEGLSVKARTVERIGERIVASGDVEIETAEVELLADRVELNIRTQEAKAEGNVVIIAGSEVVRAERASLNLRTGSGSFEKASGLAQPTFIFDAEKVAKTPQARLELEKARFTICTQPVPRWSFSVREARLRHDGYLVLKDAVLKIKKIPVLYVPYLRYPLEKRRATGFLMPRIGFSGAKGTYLSQSFYLALRPNMDATLGLELYSARGIGAAIEYRYLFAAGTKGQINLYHFNGKKTAGETEPRRETIVRLNHTQSLPLGFDLSADVDYQSSFAFLREYDDDFRRAVTATRSWQGVLSRSWSRFNFNARVSSYETYFSEIGDSIVNKSLPQVNFNIFRVKIIPNLFFSLSSSYNNFEYGWSGGTGGPSRRLAQLSIQPSLVFPFASIPWLTAAFKVNGNLNSYSRSVDPGTGTLIDTPLTIMNYSGRIDLAGPVFYRVYHGRDGTPRFKHIIEPSLAYAYDSPVDEAERIYTVSGYFQLHQLTYGLTNRLLAKKNGQVREVLSFSLSQTRYFSPETGPLSRYLIDGRPPRLSEGTASLRYYPGEDFFLDLKAGYNPYTRRFSTFSLSGGLGSRQAGNFVSVNWLKSENAWMAGVDPVLLALSNRHEVSVFTGVKLPVLSLDLLADAAYDLREGKFRYTGGKFVYHYQCVDFQVDLKVFNFRSSSEVQIKFSIGLGSISRAAEFLDGLGF